MINSVSKPMSDAHIHAYVDGQLKRDREQRLQRLIADRPEKYEQVQEYQVINERLELGLNSIINESLPLTLRTLGQSINPNTSDGLTKNQKKPRKPSTEKSLSKESVGKKQRKQVNSKNNAKASTGENIFFVDEGKQNKSVGTDSKKKRNEVTVEKTESEKPKPEKSTKRAKSAVDEVILKEDEPSTPSLNIDIERNAGIAVFRSFNDSGKLKWLVAIFIGAVGGWFTHSNIESYGKSELSYMAQYVVDAHRLYATENRHAVEVSALDKTHLDRWIEKRLKSHVEPTNLTSFGYELMGGRVLPLKNNVTGMYMYKNATDHSRLSIFVSSYMKGTNNSIPKCDRISLGGKNKLSFCGWQKAGLVYYVVASKIPADVNIIATHIKQADAKPS